MTTQICFDSLKSTLYYLGPVKRSRVSSEQDVQKSLLVATESRTLRTRQQTNDSITSSTDHAITSVQLRSTHVSLNFEETNLSDTLF